jgi:hypothetical protein
MNESVNSPIIIVGMHRSGTSILSELLDDLGLFVGHKKEVETNESFFFRNINKWILKRSSARWDAPKPFRFTLESDKRFNLTVDYVKYIVDSFRVLKYTGVFRIIKYGHIRRWNKSWGWKDPRNTITLPVWKKVFPNARIINIERHGVDVAKSIVERSKDSLRSGIRRYTSKKKYMGPIYWARLKGGGFGGSVRGCSLESAFSLWMTYRQFTEKNIKDSDTVYSIKYEDLLRSPESVLQGLTEFCDLSVSSSSISRTADKVDSSRAYAFREEPKYVEFATKKSEQLKSAGYSP